MQIQLRRERTEERRKMFQLADRRRRGGSGESNETPFSKWKKLLGNIHGAKSLDDTPKQDNEEILESVKEEKNETKSKGKMCLNRNIFTQLIVAISRFLLQAVETGLAKKFHYRRRPKRW